ncbi:hypothetical protein BXZ70DRAFT_448129 [Cristinia sonorae]|uniref:Uncharacterized protein n=1 Tax=Cristinia sonorae TaxID=1940300 RepID=A0A8K0UI09_9AGAR|nr:hypothetical protein BXZ70DRAFT_448129 [Cristinia sonorae]
MGANHLFRYPMDDPDDHDEAAHPAIPQSPPQCFGLVEHPDAARSRDLFNQGLLSPASPLFTHFTHGLAYTTGSALGSLPPSAEACLETFTVSNRVGLMAGTRAWAKHAHRSTGSIATSGTEESDAAAADNGSARGTKGKGKKGGPKDEGAGWWGRPSGPVKGMNERALELFWKVMNGATWKNLHWLPHDVLVYEIRVPEGYGMRWSQDRALPVQVPSSAHADRDATASETGGEESAVATATSVAAVDEDEQRRLLDERPWIFRGFVEPMMENGHELGWRH